MSQIPAGHPYCLYWCEPVSKEVSIGMGLLLWGQSSRRLSDWTQVTWKLVAENKLEPRLLHVLALTIPIPLLRCLAENLCPNVSWFVFAATENSLLECPMWQVYTKSSYDFDLCPLFLSPFSTNLSHLPVVSWLLHPDSQNPYYICYSGKYISTCFWQVIESSW